MSWIRNLPAALSSKGSLCLHYAEAFAAATHSLGDHAGLADTKQLKGTIKYRIPCSENKRTVEFMLGYMYSR